MVISAFLKSTEMRNVLFLERYSSSVAIFLSVKQRQSRVSNAPMAKGWKVSPNSHGVNCARRMSCFCAAMAKSFNYRRRVMKAPILRRGRVLVEARLCYAAKVYSAT